MKSIQELLQRKPWLGWLIFVLTAAAVFLLGLFASTIVERRSESAVVVLPVKPLAEWESRNEVWGANYPHEYESFRRTIESGFRSKYAGSAPIDYLADSPAMIVLWAGYAFSRDYTQAMGHEHAVDMIRRTLRTGVPQPGTCWTCKSSDVPRLMHEMGVETFYKTPWSELGAKVSHNIGCLDCHDPRTMNLRISRPALVEALRRRGRDIDRIGQQEMRSLVCAQCHVEYYFKGEGKVLTFPWDRGMSADDAETYYNEVQHTDWVHGLSRAPMLKAQHPDYEVYLTGVHAARGVSCADCHMPYVSSGGVKYTDHHIQSPLNNIANSCQVCHRESEQTLRDDVTSRQDRVMAAKKTVEQTLVAAHVAVRFARENGVSEADLTPALQRIRSAQWRWDYVSSTNGVGFHSPVESLRLLAAALDGAYNARLQVETLLAARGFKLPLPQPDLSSKEAAWRYIGLDMKKIVAEKEEFLRTAAAAWQNPRPSNQ